MTAEQELYICSSCGTRGAPTNRTKGRFWRRSTKENVCRTCGATTLEPVSSAAGQQPVHRPPVEATPPAPDPVKELQRLEGMRDRGALSREEFAEEKRKLLGAQSYRRI